MANTRKSKAKVSPSKSATPNKRIFKSKIKQAVPKQEEKKIISKISSKDETSNISLIKSNPDKISEHNENNSTPIIESNKFQCNLCETFFNDIQLLETHVRQLHFDEKPFKCNFCHANHDFWDLKEFLSHTNEMHLNVAGLSFKCRYCNDTFIDEQKFIIHDQQHSKDTIIDSMIKLNDCHECGENFKTINELNFHRRSHNNTAKPYTCETCKRSFTRTEDYSIHRRLHEGVDVFECIYCERLFAQAKNLSQHIRRAHQECVDPNSMTVIEEVVCQYMRQKQDDKQQRPELNEIRQISEPPPLIPLRENVITASDIMPVSNDDEIVRNFKCFLCDLAFVKEKTLQIHCRRNHNGKYTDKQLHDAIEKALQPMLIVQENETKYLCPVNCDTPSFTNKSKLIEHLIVKHDGDKPYKCTECKRIFAVAKTLSKHIEIHQKNERPTCKYCGLVFVQYHSMLKHQKRHEGDTIHRCTICSMPFQDEKFLARHMRIHAYGKPHKCTYCDKSFAQSCDKMKHMRIHTGERPYSCNICGKTFAHLTSIKKHSFVHTNERAFQCSVCGKSFQHKSNLVVHIRTHTGERPYKCDICSKSFYASGHYNDHMRIHSGTKNYTCNVCDKKFVHQSSYQKHKRVHTGEKPHHCQLCNKRFSQPGHFKEHMRIHTNEKPYRCRECDKSFRRSDALQTHMKIHRDDINGGGNVEKKSEVTVTNVNLCTDLVSTSNYQPSIIALENHQQPSEMSANVTATNPTTVVVRTEDFSELIKFDNSNFLNVDSTAIAVVQNNNVVLDDTFNAFSYHFQL